MRSSQGEDHRSMHLPLLIAPRNDGRMGWARPWAASAKLPTIVQGVGILPPVWLREVGGAGGDVGGTGGDVGSVGGDVGGAGGDGWSVLKMPMHKIYDR